MEKLFQQSISSLQRFYQFSPEDLKILEDADMAADELEVSEFEHYIKREVNPEIPKVLAKHNLLGTPINKEYGGRGANPLVAVLVKQRLGQLGMGISSFFNVQVLLGCISVQRWGTEEQKEKYLKPALKGEVIFAFALTEPDTGSNASAINTTYEKKGDKFILNGEKYLITNGSIATHVIVFARSKSDPKEKCALIVDTKSPGFKVAMKLEEKIGLFTSDTAMLQFENIEISESCVLGQVGKGMHVAYSGLMNGRLGVASGCVGVIEGSLKASIARAKDRVQFAKPIGKYQLIQRHIAEIRQNLEMARWPLYFAAMRKAEYDKDPENKELTAEVDAQISIAKKIAARLAGESADRAVQIYGGFGSS